MDKAQAILPPLTPAEIAESGADAHRVVTDPAGNILARCSLWWRGTPPLARERLGIVGHYAAISAEAGIEMLQLAGDELAAQGCQRAVGPMDGNTWRRYRFITERGSEPAFFLEPDHPDEWPQHFAAAGFTPLAYYCSSLVESLAHEDPKSVHAEQRLSAGGITLRTLDMSRWEEELSEIYRLTVASFAGGYLYQPIPEATFHREFGRLRPFVRPELIWIAMRAGRAVGYVFNLPDILAAQRGRPVDTVILKTLAVIPDRTCAGLGRWLTQQTHRVAHRLGYVRVIHALMHEGNPSLSLSHRYARPFRRYALLAKSL